MKHINSHKHKMSEVQWITLNNRLQQGICLINNLNIKKYELLLTHIISSTSDNFFTEIELQKLQESLKLNENQLQLLLQSIAYIYKQSSKIILKPTDLQEQLVETLKFDPEKAEIFVKEWSTDTKNDLGDFETRKKLIGMSCELNLQVASDMGSKQVLPNARLQLDLSKVNEGNKTETIILELGEDDLQQLYNTLEVVQLRLDNISKK